MMPDAFDRACSIILSRALAEESRKVTILDKAIRFIIQDSPNFAVPGAAAAVVDPNLPVVSPSAPDVIDLRDDTEEEKKQRQALLERKKREVNLARGRLSSAPEPIKGVPSYSAANLVLLAGRYRRDLAHVDRLTKAISLLNSTNLWAIVLHEIINTPGFLPETEEKKDPTLNDQYLNRSNESFVALHLAFETFNFPEPRVNPLSIVLMNSVNSPNMLFRDSTLPRPQTGPVSSSASVAVISNRTLLDQLIILCAFECDAIAPRLNQSWSALVNHIVETSSLLDGVELTITKDMKSFSEMKLPAINENASVSDQFLAIRKADGNGNLQSAIAKWSEKYLSPSPEEDWAKWFSDEPTGWIESEDESEEANAAQENKNQKDKSGQKEITLTEFVSVPGLFNSEAAVFIQSCIPLYYQVESLKQFSGAAWMMDRLDHWLNKLDQEAAGRKITGNTIAVFWCTAVFCKFIVMCKGIVPICFSDFDEPKDWMDNDRLQILATLLFMHS
jgi:hypothetical protein